MKIAIPVDRKDFKSNVCKSFGRAPFFLIYDSETKESTFLNNSASVSAGGAGIKAAQTIIDHNVDALLIPQCGENASDVFQAAGIKIYKTRSDSVQESIDAFLDNKLPLLVEIHAGFHGHGGN